MKIELRVSKLLEKALQKHDPFLRDGLFDQAIRLRILSTRVI